MDKYIVQLENNFLDTVDSLRELSDQDYKDMGFPIGLINKIKKRLEPGEGGATQQISTAGGAQAEPEPDVITVSERATICLNELSDNDV